MEIIITPSLFLASNNPPNALTNICALAQAETKDIIGIHHFMCQNAITNSDNEANVPNIAKMEIIALAKADEPCLSDDALVLRIVVTSIKK